MASFSPHFRGFERLQKLLERPFKTFVAIFLAIFVIYVLTVMHPVLWISHLGLRFPNSRAGTGHFVNLISIAGLILTALGFWYTYLQLALANDRIDCYRNFYTWVHVLFDEIQTEIGRAFARQTVEI